MGNSFGGLSSGLASLGKAYETSKMASAYRRAAEQGMPAARAIGAENVANAKSDWEKYQKNYRPVATALAKKIAAGPDFAGAEGAATTGVAEQAGAARAGLTMNPGAGAFRARMSDLAEREGGARANAITAAHNSEADVDLNRKMGLIKLTNPALNNKLNAVGVASAELLGTAGEKYGKFSGSLANQSADALGSAAYSFGKMSFGKNKNESSGQDPDWYSNGGIDRWREENPDKTTDYVDDRDMQADGGIVRGAGTGTSDSVPAVIDGVRSARLSNGEYHLPAEVTEAIGKDRLDAFLAKHHTHKKPASARGLSGAR